MIDDVKKILEYAIMAPSGDNCQPWRFSYAQEKLEVFNDPGSDFSLYSWGQRASLVSHGALLQNLFLASSALGYKASIIFLPDKNNENHVATVTFEKIADKHDEAVLLNISKRVTNRKVYDGKPLSDSHREALSSWPDDLATFAKCTFIQDKEKIKCIADALSTNERILFEDKKMHSFFYSHINWNIEQDQQKKTGFYIKTLELPAPATVPFKLFSNWKFLSFINRIVGFSKVLAKQNSAIYASGSAMGVISIPTEEPIDYMRAGMLFEHIWLVATSLGLSLQPLTGVLFLHLRLKHRPADFSQAHQDLIKKEYDVIGKNAGLDSSENMAVAFRIGRAEPPSARANRHLLEHFLISH